MECIICYSSREFSFLFSISELGRITKHVNQWVISITLLPKLLIISKLGRLTIEGVLKNTSVRHCLMKGIHQLCSHLYKNHTGATPPTVPQDKFKGIKDINVKRKAIKVPDENILLCVKNFYKAFAR